MNATYAALPLGLLYSLTSAAADVDRPAAATQLDPMIVSGQHPNAPGGNAQVWNGEALLNEPGMAIDDVLRGMPNFSLFRRSSSRVANPTSQGVTMRGLASSGASRTLVTLDGLPLNDPFGGWIHWSRVSGPFEQVRATPGGLSRVWASTALAGLIELETINPDGLNLHAAGGARDEQQLHVVAGAQSQGSSWRLAGHDVSGGGYTPLKSSQRGTIDVPADSDHQGADTRFQLQRGEWAFRGGASWFEEQRSNGTQLTGNETDVVVAHLGVQRDWDDQSIHWTVFWQDQTFASRFSSQAEDRNSETPALDQFDVPSRAYGSALRWQINEGTECGLDLRLTEGDTRERFFFRDGDFSRQREAGANQDLWGGYCQLLTNTSEWAIGLAARLDYWSLSDAYRFEFERSDGSILRDETYPDRSDWALSPRLDFSRSLTRSLGFRGALYGSLRAPTINELVRPFRVRSDITAANPALESEKLNGLELGLLGQALGGVWSATVYYNQIEDAIGNVTIGEGPGVVGPCGFTPGGGSCRQRQNLDELTGVGLELAATLPVSASWRLGLSAWLADTTVKTAAGDFDPAQVPDYRASLSLQREGRLSVLTRLNWVGSQFEDDLNQRQLDQYVRLDAHLSWGLNKAIALYLAGENLLDERYQVSLSGNGLINEGLPRTWHAGIRWQWDRGA